MDWHMDEWSQTETKSAPPPAGRERQPCPEGRWTFEILRSSEEGPRLKLALARIVDGEIEKGTGWVWCDPPRDQDWGRRLVASLATALEMPPAVWNATKAADLEGRQVEAEIYHRQTDTRLFVNVRSFHRLDTQPKPAARKPAKVTVHNAGGDDIPF